MAAEKSVDSVRIFCKYSLTSGSVKENHDNLAYKLTRNSILCTNNY